MSPAAKSGWSSLLRTLTGTACSVVLFLFSIAQAIVDNNNNTLSDLWEIRYNSGQLFSNSDPARTPAADPDGDGWTNTQEAAAGTDPFDANPPVGFLSPQIAHIPEFWDDTNGDGIPELVFPESITITWPTLTGKLYTLLASPDLSDGNWLPVEAGFIGSGNVVEYTLPFEEDAGSNPDRLFWRVSITDTDSDADTLTGSEEHQLGTHPLIPDTDGDGIPDGLDPHPTSGLPEILDTDGDGIPDAYDPEPYVARGTRPTISSLTESASRIVNVTAGEQLTFLITVTNPAGPPVTASNLKLFVGGTADGAVFSAVGANRFSVAWNASIHSNYPAAVLQSLTVRFQDSQNATVWLDLARFDVAEWQGMVAGLVRQGPTVETDTYSIASHRNGVKLEAKQWAGRFGEGPMWYRGPKAISLVHPLTGATSGEVQIGGNLRYPLFMISDPDNGPLAAVIKDISDPELYPQGVWYLNNWTTYLRMVRHGGTVPSWDVTVQPGQDEFHAYPKPGAETLELIAELKYWNADPPEERVLENNVWSVPARGSGRKMANVSLYAGSGGVRSYEHGFFIAPVEVNIVPCTVGSLDYPGLPIDNGSSTPVLPMAPGQWHKLSLKVGPDAGAISRGIQLRLNPGQTGTGNPDAGFAFQRKTAQGFAAFNFGADGKTDILAATEVYQQLVSPEGLTLFGKCGPAINVSHRFGIHLLPNSSTLDPVEIKTLDLLPVNVADNDPASPTGVDNVSITADPLDIGYQSKFWIMAPAGVVPPGYGTSSGTECANDMKIKIPFVPSSTLVMEFQNPNCEYRHPITAAAGTSPITLGQGLEPLVRWHGTVPETRDLTPTFKLGADAQLADLPIRLKIMKKRTVKVAVYPVHHQFSNRPVHKPDEALLEQRLNEIYGSQVNAWFDVTYRDEGDSPYAVKPDPEVSSYSASWGLSPETSMVTAQKFNEPAHDIVVFLIDNVSYFAGGGLASGASYPFLNKCVVNVSWDSGGVIRSDERIIQTIAHEIGHVMLGDGHPDVNNGGIAPLQGTDRTKRLMCDGANSDADSKLLVKTEWDRAEEWLKQVSDKRWRNQNSITDPNAPTGNY